MPTKMTKVTLLALASALLWMGWYFSSSKMTEVAHPGDAPRTDYPKPVSTSVKSISPEKADPTTIPAARLTNNIDQIMYRAECARKLVALNRRPDSSSASMSMLPRACEALNIEPDSVYADFLDLATSGDAHALVHFLSRPPDYGLPKDMDRLMDSYLQVLPELLNSKLAKTNHAALLLHAEYYSGCRLLFSENSPLEKSTGFGSDPKVALDSLRTARSMMGSLPGRHVALAEYLETYATNPSQHFSCP